MLQGDFNAYTGTQPDFILNDYSKNIPLHDVHYVEDQFMPRNNKDPKLPNNSGKLLLNLCKESGLRILNGRKIGDPQGNFTCITYNGCSVVDYILVSQELLKCIGYFEVHNFTSLSNHCALSCNIFSCFNFKMIDPCPLDPLPAKFLWSPDAIEKYRQCMISEDTTEKLQNFLNSYNTNPDEAVTDLNSIMIENARKSAKLITKSVKIKNKKIHKKPWTSDNCKDLHTSVKNYQKLVSKFPYNGEYRKKFYTLRSKLRRLCKYEEKQYKKKICTELSSASEKDPKLFWNLLNKLENKQKSDHTKLPCKSFIEFYKNLNKSDDDNSIFHTNISNKFKIQLDRLNNEPVTTEFDEDITLDEIKKAICCLRNGKSSSSDMISNEMIKNAVPSLLKPLHKLFNLVLKSGSFPKLWNESYLVLIHKKGDKLDPVNYRGISITSNLGKLFNKILCRRIVKFMDNNNLISKNQIGFKEKNRPSDHILTLKSIVDSKKINRKKVFAAFIDLRKAFDTVWRTGLYYKILQEKFPPQISKILISMYTNTSYQIKFENGLGPRTLSERGVKQGDVLSPILFNFFINDIVNCLNQPNTDPVVIGNSSVNILLFADDIVLLSESQSGLQTCLDNLHSYCKSWKLEVNTDKSKVIVFNSNGKTFKNTFLYNNVGIETVSQYVYLGITMKFNGNFNVAINALIDKARKAYFKIKKTIGLNNPCKLLEKLFDSLVSPVLLYCSEIWGVDLIVKESPNPLEKFHLKFIKEILGVHCKSSNDACRAELARLPLKNKICSSIIGFFNHLLSDENTLVYEIYNLTKSSNIWVKHVKKLLNSLGYSYLNTNPAMLKANLGQLKQRINDICAQEQHSNIKNSSKLSFFLEIHKLGKRPAYVDKLINLADRSMICRLRTSSHSLMIEKGRHLQIPTTERICPHCNIAVEDEVHFLLNCSCYEQQRIIFNNKLSSIYKSYNKMSNSQKVNIILDSKIDHVLKMSSNFISDCLEIAKNKMS